jgi:serine phosphatase RsbU (regulator of sigma subunit)
LAAIFSITPPGLFDPSVDYEIVEITLEPGESVLFFTDGLPDAVDLEGESLGVERLQAVCESSFIACRPRCLEKSFRVSAASRVRAQHDDMAAAIFHCDEE